jgi:hypothetical protein
LKLKKREPDEGTLVELQNGCQVAEARFTPDHGFEEAPLPSVRAPNEGMFCLKRLALLVASH